MEGIGASAGALPSMSIDIRRPRVLVMIMAGGKGERLHPLTRERSKPAVPFGGRYRIIDFVLSNFVNSQLLSLYVLVQYKSQSLIEHLRLSWRTTGIVPDYFVTVVPPQMRHGTAWYRGTADAVLQNLNLLEDFNPDIVAIFGADHIYRMDVNQMVAFHRDSGADVTVAARHVKLADASSFGVLYVDRNWRVELFEEKPKVPKPLPDNPEQALVSMGNYIFSRRALVDALLADARRSTDHDFGRSIIPELVPGRRVFAYDFETNEVPGVKPYEENGYWRDVGTIESYWDAHMDLLGESPAFDLDNQYWPIRTGQHAGPAARFIGSDIDNAQVAEGSLVKRATLRNSILGRSVWVNEGAQVEDCIIMDHTTIGKGARLRRAIVDRYNIIAADTEIGFEPDADRRRFHVDASGLVVVPRGGRREFLLGLEEM
jgi:glucose-1-phosphate adenylyltransferase